MYTNTFIKSDVCLIVIFNHRYDKNLSILEEIYKDRFHNRYYLVPFYDGDMENVIPVFGRSIFFQGYIAQAAKVFINEEFKHYLFVADDMVLHPNINEKNYRDFFEVINGQSWISETRALQNMGGFWIGTLSAIMYRQKQKYVEVENELPSYTEAINKMNNQGVVIRPLTIREAFGRLRIMPKSLGEKACLGIRTINRISHPFRKKILLKYPFCGAYSDILLVSQGDIKKFCHYCGVFASTCLFVEVAIPTALVLAANMKLVTENETKHKGKSYWKGVGPFYKSYEDSWDWLEKNFKNYDDIIARFPDNQIYMHPIKLSKWINRK